MGDEWYLPHNTRGIKQNTEELTTMPGIFQALMESNHNDQLYS